jgi:RHS repeat-associated protein
MGIKRTLSRFLIFVLLLLSINLPIANAVPTEQLIFHHPDHLSGASVDTDSNGNVIESVDYYPYGEIRVDAKTTTYENKYKFTGKELDESDNLYYYGARYYDPAMGRFISADPVDGDLTNPQSFNKYSYVLNNPLKYVDPTGNWSMEAFGQFLEDLGSAFLSTLDMIPITGDISDVYVSFTGKTLFSQQSLSQEDINLTVAMATIPILTGGQTRMAAKVEEEINEMADETYNKISKVLNDEKIKISPSKLLPTEKAGISKVKELEKTMSKQVWSSKPVKFYEYEGSKYIVDGHHRAQAAMNLGVSIYAKKVEESYFQKIWEKSEKEFIDKIKNFYKPKQ